MESLAMWTLSECPECHISGVLGSLIYRCLHFRGVPHTCLELSLSLSLSGIPFRGFTVCENMASMYHQLILASRYFHGDFYI